MENGISRTSFVFTSIAAALRIAWFAAAAAFFACSGASQSADNSAQAAVRVKTDAARNRQWVLGLADVRVYDTGTRQLIRRIALPAWSVAGIKCAPDLVLDRAGSAFVSSNAEPRLWRIDAAEFGLREYALILHGHENWETGFSALAFAADGNLFGVSAFAGSLWRIDITGLRADEIKLSERLANTCTLNAPRATAQPAPQSAATLCAATAKGSRRIVITPDISRGRVSNEDCSY